ncbi:uncharacterized protein LOC128889274 [Hylaeus anthracinus]|uniref:uncharacterized protein LOC128889274 n=1 Tax=Hylaeus anthracinus TaxID=313031 RepID=UPI0023B9E13B|nr:uncharacterized protein LOC128889274 [Hylaeus anthracinus]
MKFLIVLVAALAIASANPERERRSIGWGHNGAVVLGGVIPGVAVAGPVAPAAAVVGPVAGSAAVVGPAAGPTVIAGPAGSIVAPGSGVLGLW